MEGLGSNSILIPSVSDMVPKSPLGPKYPVISMCQMYMSWLWVS